MFQDLHVIDFHAHFPAKRHAGEGPRHPRWSSSVGHASPSHLAQMRAHCQANIAWRQAREALLEAAAAERKRLAKTLQE
jgi:hypothetical protein